MSPEFISTSGMQVIDRRDFRENASAENSNVIVNESMARLLGSDRAVGKIIQSSRGNPDGVFSNMTVIGVLKDYVYGNVYGQAGLLSKDFLRLVCIACLIAFPLVWWMMHNWLQGYEYRIAISWWVFLVAGGTAVLIALLSEEPEK